MVGWLDMLCRYSDVNILLSEETLQAIRSMYMYIHTVCMYSWAGFKGRAGVDVGQVFLRG